MDDACKDALQGSLGVAVPNEAKMCVVTTPVGPYYGSGLADERDARGVSRGAYFRWKPIALYADAAFVRAPLGGVGQYKMGW